jgi:hypothetical protein
LGALELELSALLEQLCAAELEDWALELDDLGAGFELLEGSTLLDDEGSLDDELLISILLEKKISVLLVRKKELDEASLEDDLLTNMISILPDGFSSCASVIPSLQAVTIPPKTAIAYIHILCIL